MVPNIKEYPSIVHLIHCIGELMNDNRIVDIKTKLDIDLQKEEVKRRDILECLNTASLFGMFLNSLDFRNSGLYADRFILGIKNAHVNKILYYFMNDTWPRDTMQEFLNYNKYPTIEANEEVTKYFVSNKVSHDDKTFRSKIISGFDRLCPYVSSQKISPFEVLVLIYLSSLKQMVFDRKIESIPHCNWKLKETRDFLTTGKLDKSLLENEKDRELFDYDNHGFDKFLSYMVSDRQSGLFILDRFVLTSDTSNINQENDNQDNNNDQQNSNLVLQDENDTKNDDDEMETNIDQDEININSQKNETKIQESSRSASESSSAKSNSKPIPKTITIGNRNKNKNKKRKQGDNYESRVSQNKTKKHKKGNREKSIHDDHIDNTEENDIVDNESKDIDDNEQEKDIDDNEQKVIDDNEQNDIEKLELEDLRNAFEISKDEVGLITTDRREVKKEKAFGIKLNKHEYNFEDNMLQNFVSLVRKDAMGKEMTDYDKAMLYSLSETLATNENSTKILKSKEQKQLFAGYFSRTFINEVQPKDNVLLLGMSYLDINSEQVDLYEDLIYMRSENYITEMDARDVYRIKVNEWHSNVNCFTVSRFDDEKYCSEKHLSCDFCTNDVVYRLKSKFPNIMFEEIICDWFWSPSSYFDNKSIKSFFTDVFVQLVEKGILKGCIFCPFNIHFLIRLAVEKDRLENYFDIYLLDKNSSSQSTLWNSTHLIQIDELTKLGTKDPEEQMRYCTISKISAVKGSNDGTDIQDKTLESRVNELLSKNKPKSDISEIRTICLQRKTVIQKGN